MKKITSSIVFALLLLSFSSATPVFAQAANKPLCTQTKNVKFGSIKTCVKENDIVIKWLKYRGKAKYNSYSLLMKADEDFIEADLAIGINPLYVPTFKKQYTFKDLEPGGVYFFKVGVGNYKNGQFSDYGNFSESLSVEIPDIGFDED